MRFGNRDFNDECAICGNVLECELCKDGHGIYRERSRMMEMLECQLNHHDEINKRKREMESRYNDKD